ncbi:MAG: 16S rRNA (guanine(527)-N(7))-methyltransferase RsmG [Alphaproteobacteria bacterium]
MSEGAALLSFAAFQEAVPVSRETGVRLSRYIELLSRWQRSINLVGATTLEDPWRRHILDAAQLDSLIPSNAGRITDFGSGAGIPGLILAILGRVDVHLIESDARKCVFLREAARLCDAPVTVHQSRIETQSWPTSVAVARALAPLDRLIALTIPYLTPNSLCFFLKGRGAKQELTEAEKRWIMPATCLPSRSDPAGAIVRLEGIPHERSATL